MSFGLKLLSEALVVSFGLELWFGALVVSFKLVCDICFVVW